MGICRLAWLDIEEGRLPVEDGLLSADAINATRIWSRSRLARVPTKHNICNLIPFTKSLLQVTA